MKEEQNDEQNIVAKLTEELNKCQLNNLLVNADINSFILYPNANLHVYKNISPAAVFGIALLNDKRYEMSLWKHNSIKGREYYSGYVRYNKAKSGRVFMGQHFRSEQKGKSWLGQLCIDDICYSIEGTTKELSVTNYKYIKGKIILPDPVFFSEATFKFIESERGQRNIMQHKTERGYTNIVTNVYELRLGDEIAFPYGNNVFRAVVSFVGTLNDGKRYIVLNEAIDLNTWRQKQLVTQNSGMRQLVICLQELERVEVLQKTISDKNYVTELSSFYRMAFHIMGRRNYAV